MTTDCAKIKLLLVDDRQDFLDILSERLCPPPRPPAGGWLEVTTASSDWKALDAVERQSFDVTPSWTVVICRPWTDWRP